MHSRGHCALHIYLVLFLRNFQQQFENYELNVSVWRVWYRLETVNNGDIWTFVGLFFCNLFLFLFSFFFQFVHHRCVYMVDITNDTATNMEPFFFFFVIAYCQRYKGIMLIPALIIILICTEALSSGHSQLHQPIF